MQTTPSHKITIHRKDLALLILAARKIERFKRARLRREHTVHHQRDYRELVSMLERIDAVETGHDPIDKRERRSYVIRPRLASTPSRPERE